MIRMYTQIAYEEAWSTAVFVPLSTGYRDVEVVITLNLHIDVLFRAFDMLLMTGHDQTTRY